MRTRNFLIGLLILLLGFALGAGAGVLVYAEQAGGRFPERISGSYGDVNSASGAMNNDRLTGRTVPTSLETGSPVGGSFVRDIYKKVAPSVVFITTKTLGFEFWTGRQTVKEGTGSGFIVDSRGYILTNAHVVVNADSITVLMGEGKGAPARLVGFDLGTDTALLKINPPQGKPLPVAPLGESSSLEVGDWVVAIGNPYGLDRTVTFGVVSALGRSIVAPNRQTIRNVIQTDAAINPGNSGGPLLNAKGEVVGINSVILTRSGGSEGIGLSIPIDTVKEILNDLMEHGRVLRAWLGVEVDELDRREAVYLGLSISSGLIVTAVYKDSPAAKAGILPPVREEGVIKFYVVRKADGTGVTTYGDLLNVVRDKKAGDVLEVELVLAEGGTEREVKKSVTLETLPEEAPATGII